MSEFNHTPDDGMEVISRMWQLFMPLNNMWQRVLKDPSNPDSYKWTDDEFLVIKHTAESFLSGDRSGK